MCTVDLKKSNSFDHKIEFLIPNAYFDNYIIMFSRFEPKDNKCNN